jgi:hypothetical protein
MKQVALAALVLACAGSAGCAHRAGPYGPSVRPGPVHTQDGAVRITSERISRLITEMELGSAAFRSDYGTLRRSAIPIIIGTFEELGLARDDRFAGVASAYRLKREPYARSIVLIINLGMMDERYRYLPRPIQDAEIMATIAHEVAHIVGVAATGGDVTRFCADPAPGDPDPLESCVMIRENQVRSELGLPLARSYAKLPLFLVQQKYDEHGVTVRGSSPAGLRQPVTIATGSRCRFTLPYGRSVLCVPGYSAPFLEPAP